MATCQNGYPAIPTGTDPRLVAIPRIAGRVRRGGPDIIFDHLVNFFDTNIEDIDKSKDEWGYAYRPVRGQATGYSNHAGGYAIDVNAMQHPRGVRGTFTREQIRKMDAFLKNDLEGVVRWGEKYTVGKVDGMHFEIIGSPAAVARVAAKLSKAPAVIAPTGKPKPKPITAPAVKAYPAIALIVDGRAGSVTVKALQVLLRDVTKDYKGKLTGAWDKATIKAMQVWLKRIKRYGGLIDGKLGPMTIKALQSLLRDRAGYKGYIDGKLQSMSAEALQRYLNGQRRYA